MSVPDDVEGRCISCQHIGGGGDFDSYYCKKARERGISNVFFSARYDGTGCEYYEYD